MPALLEHRGVSKLNTTLFEVGDAVDTGPRRAELHALENAPRREP